MGKFLRHTDCPRCGSSDAGAVYEDGSCHCFSCANNWDLSGDIAPNTKSRHITEDNTTNTYSFVDGTYKEIDNRSLKEATCQKFGYQVSLDNKSHIANYRDPKTNQIVAQKIRKAGKVFNVIGNGRDMPLYGQHLWSSGGKSVVITEGEIDALSVAQAFDLKWPVVSLPNGAQSALKSIKTAYEWLSSFEKIVIAFDMDEPGQKAAVEVAEALPVGKAYIMRMPGDLKDANDVLKTLGTAAITRAFWEARPYRPDGIVGLEELRQSVLNPIIIPSIPYPWPEWNDKLGGIREAELVTLTSGSGLGKSTLLRELAYHLAQRDIPIGGMFLEESNQRTINSLIGLHLDKNILVNPEIASASEKAAAFDHLASKKIYLWDHFGSNEIDAVVAKIHYMARALGIRYLFLDHLSILVSGLDGDERKTIDVGMTKLRTVCSETGIGMFLVSHLTRPSGDKGHEEGAKVSLKQLRGSHAIAQLSDAVIGLQKDPDDPTSDRIDAVLLKNRFSGDKGDLGSLYYNRTTSRLTTASF